MMRIEYHWSDKGSSVKLLKLNTSCALITFESFSKKCCVFLDGVSHNEELVSHLKGASAIKFVGSEVFFKNFEKILPVKINFEKKVFINSGIQSYFYPESGKVRIEKIEQKLTEVFTKKKVLIVDDSATVQKLLNKIISSSEKLEVVGMADRPSVATKMIEELKPDLITLDIHMPEMTGVEYLKTYLRFKKIPVVMISSVSMQEGPLVMEALSSGAVTYIQKPSLDKIGVISKDIVQSLETVATAKTNVVPSSASPQFKSIKFQSFDGLIAIGSSTGGTQALQSVFSNLPSEIPPIVVVQHIPAVFSKALADRLNSLCPFRVKEAEHEEELIKNTIYIAPGDKQMRLSKLGQKIKIQITDDPPVNRFKPSVDYLFDSIAGLKNIQNTKLVAAILTGMGKDGAQGLLNLKNVGALTIAQDEATSTVYGMPREAARIGAADAIEPLDKIAIKMALSFNKAKAA